MHHRPEPDRSLEEVESEVSTSLENHEVILFMKGNALMPQCGYSRKALALITMYREDVEVVDVLPALPHYRTVLKEYSGRETIPQAFVNGEFIGGSDILEQLHEQAELEETLESA